MVDFQTLYPSSMVPGFISILPKLYFQMCHDPLVGGVMGYLDNAGDLGWFKSFIVLEL
jgi:hypothetical protein